MKVLAMDTALPQGGAALLEGERVVGSRRFGGASGHAAMLPAAIQGLLEEAGWHPRQLELVAVTNGPGSFTGVRIALGVAKGMALASGIRVVTVSTLAAVAAGAASQAGGGEWVVAPLLDARREELYAAVYHLIPGDWYPREILAPAVWAEGELTEILVREGALQGLPLLLAGNGLVDHGTLLRNRLGERCRLASPEHWAVDPVVVARLGVARFARQGRDQPLLMEPLYLRRPEAERLMILGMSVGE